MDKALNSALSKLHKEVTKPLGFSKIGPTFSRTHATHTEIFNIQASQWNGPWGRHFYVNCYLIFSDVPFLTPSQRTHRNFRIEDLVVGAPSQFDYTEETIESVREKLGVYLIQASELLSKDLALQKEKFFAAAELWRIKQREPTT